MKANQVLHYILANDSGVQAFIGAATPRCYYVVAPQDPTLPFITHRTITSERLESIYSDPGYATVRVQLTCFADTAQEVMQLAEAVRNALERTGSGPGGTPIDGVTVYDIKIGSEAQSWEPDVEAFAHATDYLVLHAE